MKRTVFFALGVLLGALASAPAMAQQHGTLGRAGSLGTTGPHGLNPSLSLSAPSSSPLAAQMEDDYAAQLQAEQRESLQQNPSGLTRQELSVGHELNGFTPR